MSKRYFLSKEERKDITDRGNRKLITERYIHDMLRRLQIVGRGKGAWEGGEWAGGGASDSGPGKGTGANSAKLCNPR